MTRRPALHAPAIALPLAVLCVGLGGCPRFQQGPTQLAPDALYVTLGRDRVLVKDVGPRQATAVLFIHGYSGSHDNWAVVAPRLEQRHRLLLVDLPGFGKSDKYAGDYSPGGLSRRLLALLDDKKIARAHVVGHSWGTSVALALALQAPDRVATLTLLAPWVFEEQLAPFLRWARVPVVGEALFALFYDQRLDDRVRHSFYEPGPFTHPDIVDRVRASMRRPGAKAAALAAARGMRFSEMQRRYHRIAQPALVIAGRQDPISWLRHAERLDKLLPDSRLVVLDRCGHVPQLERPADVARHLGRFLAEHDPQSSGGHAP